MQTYTCPHHAGEHNREHFYWECNGKRRCKPTHKAKYIGDAGRDRNLRARYRMTNEQYEQMLADQGGGCAICGSNDRLHVDHDHSCCPGRKSCGKCIRGILCHSCNTAIGSMEDDQARLEEAILYLQIHNKD